MNLVSLLCPHWHPSSTPHHIHSFFFHPPLLPHCNLWWSWVARWQMWGSMSTFSYLQHKDWELIYSAADNFSVPLCSQVAQKWNWDSAVSFMGSQVVPDGTWGRGERFLLIGLSSERWANNKLSLLVKWIMNSIHTLEHIKYCHIDNVEIIMDMDQI